MARSSFAPSAPNKLVWIVAVVLGLLGLLGTFFPIDTVSAYSFELVAVGFVLLLIGTLLKGI